MQQAQQPKRDMLAIMLKILDIANEPVRKTHILYSAGINFYQLSRYLNFLLKLGLLEELSEPHTGYRTTEKGRACLRLFNTADLEEPEQVESSVQAAPRPRRTKSSA